MSTEADSHPQRDAIEREIVEYIREEILGPDVSFDREADLLGEGMLDSLGVLRLATHVDETFRLEMQPADFVIENFRSVAALGRYVQEVVGRRSDGSAS